MIVKQDILYQQPFLKNSKKLYMNKETYKSNKSDKKSIKFHQCSQQQENELKFAGISKQEFSSWLKALSSDERYLTLRIRSPELTSKLIQLNNKFGQSWKIQIDGKKVPTRSIKNFIMSLQNFIDGLVLISDQEYLDSIGFDFSFVGCPEKLYETLTNLLNGFNRIKNKSKVFLVQQYFKQLPLEKQQWICQLIKKIQQDYIIKKKTSWDPLILEKQKIQKKQFGNFWKSLSKINKINYLYAEHQDIKSLTLKLMDNEIKIDPIKLQEQIQQLFDLDKKQICNKVFKCKLKKCSIGIYKYYQLLYENWRQYAAKYKNESKYNINSKKKHKNYQNISPSVLNPIKKRQKSLDACSNQTNETQLKDSRIQISQQQIYKNIQQDIIQCTDYISQQSNKYHQKRILAFQRLIAIFRLYNVSCKLFGSCASGIAIKDSDIDVAINQNILQYFKYDINNNNIILDKKIQMNKALQFISQIFQSVSWISNQKVIKTAAIPIIKLIIHTEIQVTQEYFTQQYKQILNRKIQNYGNGEVHVDLTIQTTQQQIQEKLTLKQQKEKEKTNHLGIVSTQQINKWLSQIPTLRPIIIMLKYYLAKKSLNQTYLGGLNTYCLVVLIVSYIYSQQLNKQQNVGKVFYKLLNFYGWEFNQINYGIDLRNKNKIYYEKSKNQQNKFANLQVKDPLNQGKIMTRNCYQFQKIKEIFKNIYNNCFIKKENLLKEQHMLNKRKNIKKCKKQQSQTQSGSQKDRLKNFFIQYFL